MHGSAVKGGREGGGGERGRGRGRKGVEQCYIGGDFDLNLLLDHSSYFSGHHFHMTVYVGLEVVVHPRYGETHNHH